MALTIRPAALVAAVLLAASTPAIAQTAAPAAAPAAAPPATPPAAAPVAQTPASVAAPAERSFSIHAALGVALPGAIKVESTSYDTDAGFNLLAGADFFVIPRLSFGVYLQRFTSSAKEVNRDITMTAIGGSLTGRFGNPDQPHFRAGLGLAYQMESAEGFSKDATGFGIMPFVEGVYPVKDAAFFAHLGLNAQPSGGNEDVSVTWSPIFQLMIGAEFGK
jgi:hypothetical protein